MSHLGTKKTGHLERFRISDAQHPTWSVYTGTVRNLREEFCSTSSGPLRQVRVVFSQNTIIHDCEELCNLLLTSKSKWGQQSRRQNRIKNFREYILKSKHH